MGKLARHIGVLLFAALAAAPIASAAELRAGTVELDPARTTIEFRLEGSLHTTHGTFKLIRGTITADPRDGKAGGTIEVDAASGDSGLGARDNRMRDSILEADKYPQIVFTPQRVDGQMGTGDQFHAKLQGVMSLHGADHQMILDIDGHLSGDELTATTHFSIPYVEWGMQDPSVLLLTVAKQVEIDVATAGHVVWSTSPAH